MRGLKIHYINTIAMVSNVIFYLKRGYSMREAILLARDTL